MEFSPEPHEMHADVLELQGFLNWFNEGYMFLGNCEEQTCKAASGPELRRMNGRSEVQQRPLGSTGVDGVS